MDAPQGQGDSASAGIGLARRLNLPLLTLYGLGTTVGAGIYALVGEVAARAGTMAPAAFVLAALMAGVSALSFAEMAARLPRSAGEALYVEHAFHRPAVAGVVGLLVVAAGCVSAAAVINAFASHIGVFLTVDSRTAIVAVVAILGVVAAWGILESASVAAVITLLEVGGVLAVVWAARTGLSAPGSSLPQTFAASDAVGVFAASFIAFYAFIGFEDMVNVAEEVRDVRRTMPLAIVSTLAITTLLYVAVAVAAIVTVPPSELARSETPLLLVYERAGGPYPAALGAIALLAMVNGALIQLIMASRVVYGLATQGKLPAFFARVGRGTRTPLTATAVVGVAVAVLALGLPLAPLAEITSFITLTVFTAVNAALYRLKRTEPAAPGALPSIPAAVPAFGVVLNSSFLVLRLASLA